MKDNTLIIIGLVAIAYFMYSRPQQQQYPPQPTQDYTDPEWIKWARTIIQLAGGLYEELFGPGGPFYKVPRERVEEVMGEGSNTGIIQL